MSYNALKMPPMVYDKPAHEVMRAAVHEGELHFSLLRGFADPAAWGLLFVDAAHHVARVYEAEQLFTQQEALARIRAAFEEAIRQPPDPSREVTAIVAPE
jgi:hypothetical protein